MNRTLAALLTSACLAGALTLTGCSGSTTAGTTYTITITRHVEAYIGNDHETVYNTALETLRDTFKYEIEENKLDGRTGIIKAKTAKGNLAKFSVTRDSKSMSEVSVFVGPVGDTDAAQDILSRVEKALRD